MLSFTVVSGVVEGLMTFAIFYCMIPLEIFNLFNIENMVL